MVNVLGEKMRRLSVRKKNRGQKGTNDSEAQITKIQNDCYHYMAEFAEKIYHNEEQRESSLLQQASNMQSAFSFVIAAVFMIAAIVVEYRGILKLSFLLVSFSSITVALAFSLLAATLAQWRSKREDFPKISTIRKIITDEYENFLTEAQRDKYLVETYEKIYESYERVNDKRRKWVVASMVAFCVAMSLCVMWFVIAVSILLWR